jgi:hypothetical protein
VEWALTTVPEKPKSLSSSVIFLSTGSALDGNGDQRNVNGLGAVQGEDAAVDVVFGGGGNLVVVGGDELHAGIVERERAVAVVGEDDADGQQAVREVGQAEEAAGLGIVARLGGDGDVLVGWVSLAAYSAAGLAGGADLFAAA